METPLIEKHAAAPMPRCHRCRYCAWSAVVILAMLIVVLYTPDRPWSEAENVLAGCAHNVREIWAIRHSGDVCYDTTPYNADNLTDCPLNAFGRNLSMRNGLESPLYPKLGPDDLILVSPMHRTRGSLYLELTTSGLLQQPELLPTIRLDTALIEIGNDVGNIGTVTSRWQEKYAAWQEPHSWIGGQQEMDRWNSIYAVDGPKASDSEFARWKRLTRHIAAGRDISPQSMASLPHLSRNICSWADAHPQSIIVLVTHHVFLDQMMCTNATQAGRFAHPFRIDDVDGFLRHLASVSVHLRSNLPLCSRTFDR